MSETSEGRDLEALVDRGMQAFHRGAHASAAAILEPILDSAEQWEQVREMWDRGIDVAYAVGVGRLFAGDLDGASSALRLVVADAEALDAGYVRRALAQVELARGNLDEAAHYLDDSPEAGRWDRVLAAKLSWRRGDRAEALRRVRDEMASPLVAGEHPWDLAGAIYQLGWIVAGAGETDAADDALRAMSPLLAGAPAELPLHMHQGLLEASVMRLRGATEAALAALDAIRDRVEGQELAEWHRERARTLLAAGRADEAADEYERAIAGFEKAGDRWEAAATREERTG